MTTVGREFNHLEDLVFTERDGAERAIQRLIHAVEHSEHLEVKWDGSPAIIFGRNSAGKFHFGYKYSQTYNHTPHDVYENIMAAGGGDDREEFAQMMSKLWTLYEAATPRDFQGYVEAGLMYGEPPNHEDGFQPNTVRYTSTDDRLMGAKSYAVATAFFTDLPALDGKRSPVGDVSGFGSGDVIIDAPLFVQGKSTIDIDNLRKLAKNIRDNITGINNFITPNRLWADAVGEDATDEWRRLLYRYVNSQVDTISGFDDLGENFEAWVKTAKLKPAVEAAAIDNIRGKATSGRATWAIVRAIARIKSQLIDEFEDITLARRGLVARLPDGTAGGEGFVSDIEDGPVKLVKRETFSRTNRSMGRMTQGKVNKSSRLHRTGTSKSAVITFGRMMGHLGHVYLAEAVFDYAKQTAADPYIILSRKHDKENPLPPEEKLAIFRQIFPDKRPAFQVANAEVPDISTALAALDELGYDNVTVIAGSDRANSFAYLTKYNGKNYDFDSITIKTRADIDTANRDTAGPRSTTLRNILGEDAAWDTWRAAFHSSITDRQLQGIMNQARTMLGHEPIEPQIQEKVNITMNTQQALEQTFATNFVAYYHSHVAHFNVAGTDFYQYHKLLEKIYEFLQDSIDDLGEQIKTVRGTVPRNLSSITDSSSIDDAIIDGDSRTLLMFILNDLTALNDSYIECYEASESEGEIALSNLIQDKLIRIRKFIWMLTEILV